MTADILHKDNRGFIGAFYVLKKALKSVRSHYALLLESAADDRVAAEDVRTVLDEMNVFESAIDGREDAMRRTVVSRAAEYALVDSFGLAAHGAFTGHPAVKGALEEMKNGAGAGRFYGAACLFLYARAAAGCYSVRPDFASRLRMAEDIRLLHLAKSLKEGLSAEDVLYAVYPLDPMVDFSRVDADAEFESLRLAIHQALLDEPRGEASEEDNVIKLKGAPHLRLIAPPGSAPKVR